KRAKSGIYRPLIDKNDIEESNNNLRCIFLNQNSSVDKDVDMSNKDDLPIMKLSPAFVKINEI
ncbi:MAG: hypothetical protein MHPSP_001003, partial [Paramarteilia canceri]